MPCSGSTCRTQVIAQVLTENEKLTGNSIGGPGPAEGPGPGDPAGSGGSGGGILNAGDSSLARLQSVLVALNSVGYGGVGQDISGAFTSQGHNLIGIGEGGSGFTNEIHGDLVGTTNGTNTVD